MTAPPQAPDAPGAYKKKGEESTGVVCELIGILKDPSHKSLRKEFIYISAILDLLLVVL